MARTTTTEFRNADGETLAAKLELPAGEPRAYALLAHCFTCSKDAHGARAVARALAERGIATLRFDFTGLGQSGGDFSETTFSSNLEDLRRAAAHLRENFAAPELLVGHSLGGAAILAVAADIPEAKAVATIAAPSEASHVANLMRDRREDIERDGEATVDLGGRPFRIRKDFLDDLETHDVREAVRTLKRPLLVMHAPLDDTVGVENATEIFVAAKHPKSFVSLDDADHLLTRRADADYAASVLAAWADRFLSPVADGADDREGWAVSRTVPGLNFAQSVRVAGHTVRIDADPGDGGNGTGPNPTRVVHAALAACGAITAHMYAKRKGWPLEAVEIAVRGRPGEDQHVNRVMEKTLTLHGDLSDQQRARVREIVGKCPVHRMLTAGVEIVDQDETEKA